MPYEYRHMTPEERAAIVEERRQRGYPRCVKLKGVAFWSTNLRSVVE
jgi:hypothetical protein